MVALGRILIVDDEEPVREMLGEYFGTQGHAVETAATGTEALTAVQRARPDLVLLDIRMPGLDGVETLRRLRSLDGAIPVVMVTANEDVALARETLRIGAFDYVAKPFDFAYLDRVVAAALARARGPAARSSDEPTAGAANILTQAVSAVTARMREPVRTAVGARMERAALAAAREAASGGASAAAERLREVELLVAIAAEVGDLTAVDRALVEGALEQARRSLPVPS